MLKLLEWILQNTFLVTVKISRMVLSDYAHFHCSQAPRGGLWYQDIWIQFSRIGITAHLIFSMPFIKPGQKSLQNRLTYWLENRYHEPARNTNISTPKQEQASNSLGWTIALHHPPSAVCHTLFLTHNLQLIKKLLCSLPHSGVLDNRETFFSGFRAQSHMYSEVSPIRVCGAFSQEIHNVVTQYLPTWPVFWW